MTSSAFQTSIVWRICALALTLFADAWILQNTRWPMSAVLCTMAAVAQVVLLIHFVSRSGREVARFLDAVSLDDFTQSFAGLRDDPAYVELAAAMGRVLDKLRASRGEREEQARYIQALLTHVPVPLLSMHEDGHIKLLNTAARRLFELPQGEIRLANYGEGFAHALALLRPGRATVVHMERKTCVLPLKAAASEIVIGGARTRLLSLQNIESELSAQELAAWQTVIRVMAHEVMNSLTPIASLAGTAREMVHEAIAGLPPEDAKRALLSDVTESLETVVRRSEGLFRFVQGQRRLSRRLEARLEAFPVRRLFARIAQLFAAELETRGILLATSVEPATLEVAADRELLEQALINLVRNSIEALAGMPSPRIALSSFSDADGRQVVTVADNGPGIGEELREKVFEPFITTRPAGSGVGLTLVRQIAVAHGATAQISTTPGGGTTVSLRF